jgi:adenosine kinase
VKKYNLHPDYSYLVSNKTEVLPLFNEITLNTDLKKTPGGSCQNTIRTVQWLHPETPKYAGFTGSIGDDDFGKIQLALMDKIGVDTKYYIAKGERTGKCAALIEGTNRCLIAEFAAGTKYPPSFLFVPDVQNSINNAKIVYAELYFIDVSVEALLILAHRCTVHNKAFSLSLSAVWIINTYIQGLIVRFIAIYLTFKVYWSYYHLPHIYFVTKMKPVHLLRKLDGQRNMTCQ